MEDVLVKLRSPKSNGRYPLSVPDEMTPEELKEGLLAYFERTVLCRYRASPNLFVLEEDDMGGEVSVAHLDEDGTAGPNRPPYFRVRFGFRRLEDRRVVLAAFVPDLQRLPESERGAWAADHIEEPPFQPEDPAFDRWTARYIEGLWTSEAGPLRSLEREIDLLCALTKYSAGEPLFRSRRNLALNYPIAENTIALEFAHLELFRLVVEGLRPVALEAIAQTAGVTLIDAKKTLNSLKELLPEELHERIHEPLRRCREQRNRVHGIRSTGPKWTTAFDTFQRDLEAVVEGLSHLKSFVEEKTGSRARACLRREEAMEAGFPEFNGPARPEMKIERLNELVGRTIKRVECGGVVPHPASHQQEAIVFHFTDGSASCIRVGSNAGNLEGEFEGLKTDMFSTDLWITNAPSPRDESV